MAYRWITVLLLIGIAAGTGFAYGSPDNQGNGGWNAQSADGWYDYGNMPPSQSYSGKFGIENNRFPYLNTADGKQYYLIPSFSIAPDLLPAVGDTVRIQAFPSPRSPMHLIVTAAEVNGILLQPTSRNQYVPQSGNRNNQGYYDDQGYYHDYYDDRGYGHNGGGYYDDRGYGHDGGRYYDDRGYGHDGGRDRRGSGHR
ncbi:MAG: hypothetical protein B0D92_05140 [Spirochaeta sp. LUC14_002_19_P3]|nr:MAG: hypothetical protein B0D92_05140 [Spirochaeta sp. LUC14_002_19_P3]